MSQFNEMIELNIGLLVFVILVTLFILLGCVGNRSRNLSYMRNFVWIVCMNLVMLVGECGYILKPVTTEQITRELENLRHPIESAKAKELLAYLTDRNEEA